MISVVVYGRNDSYGYNLHKRAAISLNCIAELLSSADDEILFVDYNTPDDFPTFPEAIQDTLTEKTKSMLRILRARPKVHDRFRDKTHLVALEPVSRNIAIRRSNPRNKWILSTNTDIVFILQGGSQSLTDTVRALKPGFYEAPRLEIPETIWESFNRQQPKQIMDQTASLGRDIHLDEIVFGSPAILYDGPGDFQLMERDAIFKMHGFNEEMLLGWHVDSNLCVRMRHLYGEISDAGQDVWAYHCDHTRQTTPMHGYGRKQNDPKRFIDEVNRAELIEQSQTWGCPNDDIEEVRLRLGGDQAYVQALRTAIGSSLTHPYRASYTLDTFDKSEFPARHVLPFLTDLFASAARNTVLAWFGRGGNLLPLFAEMWHAMGFTEPILNINNCGANRDLPIAKAQADEMVERADVLIFNAESLTRSEAKSNPSEPSILSQLFGAVIHEHTRLVDTTKHPRRFIGIDAIHSRFESTFTALVGSNATPFSSRIRHGFVLPKAVSPTEYIQAFELGLSGSRNSDGGIQVALHEHDNTVFYGPYRTFLPGFYVLRMEVYSEHQRSKSERDIAQLEVITRGWPIASRVLTAKDLERGQFSLSFEIPTELLEDSMPCYEFKLRALDAAPFTVKSVTAASNCTPSPMKKRSTVELVGNLANCMRLGTAGTRVSGTIQSTSRMGHVLFGPHWNLSRGRYKAVLKIRVHGGALLYSTNAEFAFEAMIGNKEIAISKIAVSKVGSFCAAVNFTVSEPLTKSDFELRVWSNGARRAIIESIQLIPQTDLKN